MIPLAMPNLTGNEKKYLEDCIDTTYVSSVGEYVNRFEKMVADATGSKYAVATSSGTTGLHAALVAVGVKPGDLVIIPTFTFIATANAVAHCGAIPWLMDISIDDWCISVEQVKSALADKCRLEEGCCLIHKETGRRVAAIMPVYTLGNIPDMETITHVVHQYNLPVVADAACAIGATYKNKPFGGLADVSVLSFNGNKTVTCGGGGAVVGNDEELLQRIRHLTTTARCGKFYDFDEIGFNYRMTNIQAAVGCAQMERLDEFVERKREIRSFYQEKLQDVNVSFFPKTDGSSCWFSGILLQEGIGFNDVCRISERLQEKKIEARTFWKPIHMQEPYEDVPRECVNVSERVWKRVLSLPCSTNLSDDEIKYVVYTLVRLICI